jgi:uncharacterized protein with HEPN domain
MDNHTRSCLYDILNAIHEIDSFFETSPKLYEAYQYDIKTKRAVERNIEIIGEAMNRILQINTEISITHARNIVDTRNRIIHGYDSVSDEVIWGIVVNYLPVLYEEVSLLLGE